jgi:hypothetical protein
MENGNSKNLTINREQDVFEVVRYLFVPGKSNVSNRQNPYLTGV